MGKRFFLLVQVYCLTILGYSQSTSPYSTLQRVIPPSPEAISIAKAGFSDVNLYTGKASYSLPIYTISQNGISLPISLSYVGGGGIKVEELGSIVGLGWSLSSTGMVTRAIRGVADDTYAGNYIGYMHLPDFPPLDTNATTIQTYTYYAQNKYDAQPDLFSVSVAGVNAQFYINKNKKVVFVEKSDLKITPVFSGYAIIAFEVKDLYGRTYYFNELEKSKSEPVDDNYAEYEDYNTSSWYLTKITSEYGKDIITFTYLSGENNQIKHDVQSPYQYREPNSGGFYTDNTSFSHLYYKRPVLQKISFASGEVNFKMSDSSRYDINGDKYLKSIVVKNYLGDTIKQMQFFNSYFSTTGVVQQGQGTHLFYGNSALRLKLDSVQDISKTNQKLTYKFVYETSHFLPDRMGSFQVDHWGFYNGAIGNTGWEPNYRLKYYFQLWAMSDPVTYYVENGSANREPNFEYAKSGVLKEVFLPTGGKIRYDYELNTSSDSRLPNIVYDTSFFSTLNYSPNYFNINLIREPFAYVNITSIIDNPSYSYEYELFDSANATSPLFSDTLVHSDDNHEYKVEPGTYFVKVRVLGAHPDTAYQYFARVYYEKEKAVLNKMVGGLRIRAMHMVDSAMNTDLIRNYFYNESGDTSSSSPSTGEIAREPKYGLQFTVMWSDDYVRDYFSAAFIIPQGYMRQLTSAYPLGVTSGNTVGYRKVTTVDSNLLRSEYYFTSYKEFPELADGYVHARLSDDDIRVIDGNICEVMPYAPDDERDFLRGKLKKQIEFRKENGVFQKIHQVENVYGFNMGYEIDKFTHMLPDTLEYLTGMLFNIEQNQSDPNFPYYTFKRYSLYTTKYDLTRTIDKQYSYQGNAIDSLVTQSDIYYGDTHWYIDSLYHYQPTKITKFTNTGSEVSKIYYPYHWRYDVPFADAAEEAKMQTLETANRIAVPVLQIVEDSATNYHLSSVKNTYASLVSGKLAPNFIKTKIGSSLAFEDNISFNRYDTLGNLIEQQKVNDIKSVYLWDHKNSLPVAEITNADSASVAYSSFEADGKGNWTYSGSNLDTIAITGRKAYKLTGSNNITKSGLSSGNIYFVSYWTRNSTAFTITGTQSGYPLAGRSVNGWKYFEHKITGQTTISISGTGWIDELRLFPDKALMNTITYTPLIGISSRCDANNRISYYVYDAFNRLTLVRDQDNNIVKRICYNYAGQAEECYVPPAAAPSTVSIQSNNYSGMSGYTAVYTNVSTSQQTSFSVPVAAGLQTLGQLAPGTYNLTISKTGFQPTMIFGAGCNGYTISGTSATFYNIVITTSNCKTISIEYAD